MDHFWRADPGHFWIALKGIGENDQVRSTDLGGGGDVYYDYDAAGQRVRKVWEHSGLVEERIYLGGYEVYRRRDGSGLVLERQTLHVMDGARRVAMVETKTVDTSGPFTVTPRVRYHLDNHLGSASLEVDGVGLVIGYEEYHPYGTTAYWSASSAVEVSQRRYRYTGKEKDEETGLYYYGARYYAPWLGRWTSADPAGMVDGPSLYTYARDNPTTLFDPDGRAVPQQQPIRWRWPWEPIELQKGIAAAVSKSPGGATSERSEETPLEGGTPAALGAAAAKPVSAPPSPPARGEASGVFRIPPATRGAAPTRPQPGGSHVGGVVISVGIVAVKMGVGYLVEKLSAKGDGGISAPPPGPPQPPPAPGMTPVVPPPPEAAKEQKVGQAVATADASIEPEKTPVAVSTEQKGAADAATGAPRTFVSTDPQVGELATEIEARIPEIVEDVNVQTMRPNGETGTDLDIALTDGRAIQVKTGSTRGLMTQMEETVARGWDPVAYAPNASRALQM